MKNATVMEHVPQAHDLPELMESDLLTKSLLELGEIAASNVHDTFAHTELEDTGHEEQAHRYISRQLENGRIGITYNPGNSVPDWVNDDWAISRDTQSTDSVLHETLVHRQGELRFVVDSTHAGKSEDREPTRTDIIELYESFRHGKSDESGHPGAALTKASQMADLMNAVPNDN
jgi:hypothetical protein